MACLFTTKNNKMHICSEPKMVLQTNTHTYIQLISHLKQKEMLERMWFPQQGNKDPITREMYLMSFLFTFVFTVFYINPINRETVLSIISYSTSQFNVCNYYFNSRQMVRVQSKVIWGMEILYFLTFLHISILRMMLTVVLAVFS